MFSLTFFTIFLVSSALVSSQPPQYPGSNEESSEQQEQPFDNIQLPKSPNGDQDGSYGGFDQFDNRGKGPIFDPTAEASGSSESAEKTPAFDNMPFSRGGGGEGGYRDQQSSSSDEDGPRGFESESFVSESDEGFPPAAGRGFLPQMPRSPENRRKRQNSCENNGRSSDSYSSSSSSEEEEIISGPPNSGFGGAENYRRKRQNGGQFGGFGGQNVNEFSSSSNSNEEGPEDGSSSSCASSSSSSEEDGPDDSAQRPLGPGQGGFAIPQGLDLSAGGQNGQYRKKRTSFGGGQPQGMPQGMPQQQQGMPQGMPPGMSNSFGAYQPSSSNQQPQFRQHQFSQQQEQQQQFPYYYRK